MLPALFFFNTRCSKAWLPAGYLQQLQPQVQPWPGQLSPQVQFSQLHVGLLQPQAGFSLVFKTISWIVFISFYFLMIERYKGMYTLPGGCYTTLGRIYMILGKYYTWSSDLLLSFPICLK